MNWFAELDMLARGGSLALLALWSWLLVRDHWHALAARLAVAMNVSIACHILATLPTVGTDNPLDWSFELGSVTVPALFWLFARAWFNDEQRIGWPSWAVIPISMALVLVIDANFVAKNPLFYASAAALRLTMFACAIAGLWTAWRGREGDLIEARRRLRMRLVIAVGLFVILTNVVEVLAYNEAIPGFWRSMIEIGIVVLTFALCAAMFSTRHSDLLGAPTRGTTAAAPALAVNEALAMRLRDYMEREMPHRDEQMTIAKLAQRLGEQEYRLRRLINGSLGYRNFAQFLNGYRLAEVKAALADPAQREVSILTIALDAGFGSLGPFNRAFREAEGMTPSAFRSGLTG